MVPGLLNFKYYIVSLFFTVQSIMIFTTYYYIEEMYGKDTFKEALFVIYVVMPYILTPVVLPLEALY